MILTCEDIMQNFRVNPGAVARQLIVNLRAYKPLTASDEAKIIDAIESSGVEDGTNRMLATLSRNTLNELLKSI